jgi:hypothetical protein
MAEVTEELEVFCPESLRESWPEPLAREWRQRYTGLFDEDDYRLAKNQPNNHFFEWFAAVHFYRTRQWGSLIEKYGYDNHERKVRLREKILGESVEHITEWRDRYGVQPPDLMLFTGSPDWELKGFAEVKSPSDTVSSQQAESHNGLRELFEVPVMVVDVVVENSVLE